MAEIDPVGILKRAFPDLADAALAPLASLTKQKTFPAGELICKEGAFESTFYVIGAGEVEFTKRFTADEERQLRIGGPGIYFGEMALLQEEARSANVRTLSEVTVLEIDKISFQEAIQTNPVMMLGIMRTLIERMRFNDATALDEMRTQKEEIEAAYQELRHQEQLRTEFLTTLAHELRTPLTAASGYMQLIKGGMMTGPVLSMSLQKVETSIDRIVSLVNDLLFVQEQELIEPALRPVSLPALLKIVADEVNDDAYKQGVEIKVEVPPDLPTIQADPDGLVRAFTKLLENAVKFSPEGGDIWVVARSRLDWIEIEFVDSGVGIAESFMPRLFKRFERTDQIGDRVFGGAGVGLPIAKHIIESHGGSISVESEEGQGSTFTVHLPMGGGQAQIVNEPGTGFTSGATSVREPTESEFNPQKADGGNDVASNEDAWVDAANEERD